MNDEGGPLKHATQLECVNHPKVLYSKDMVLNVWTKGPQKGDQVSVKKLNESEPTDDVPKCRLVDKTIGCFELIGRL